MAETAKQTASRFVAEIDEAELTLRLLEIGCAIKRPAGVSAAEALRQIRVIGALEHPQAAKVYDDFGRMARASILYLGECVKNGSTSS